MEQRDYMVRRDSWSFFLNVCDNTIRTPPACKQQQQLGSAVTPGPPPRPSPTPPSRPRVGPRPALVYTIAY